MASSLFGSKNNVFGMIQQFEQFKQQMQGKDPKAVVQELIRSGQMSKQQFESLSNMANQLQAFLK